MCIFLSVEINLSWRYIVLWVQCIMWSKDISRQAAVVNSDLR